MQRAAETPVLVKLLLVSPKISAFYLAHKRSCNAPYLAASAPSNTLSNLNVWVICLSSYTGGLNQATARELQEAADAGECKYHDRKIKKIFAVGEPKNHAV